ncbi:winged helix-turn-helix domain-containing protein [Kaistia sp. MMO-174]|uniref:winged helix-turn-helix domain-containing protein n=1 Tax=Kaistia sp. MMO-174 TaxID=3081256 RepID=UPI001AD1AF21|nr:winged helix-turn-helix domain-containing protein [Hyphomicrobiales bacterium]
MEGEVRYGELSFDPSFLFARHGAGAELRFTRSERALLLAFTRHPRTVLTRNQLLDAIAGSGSDATDRSIDFLINRLRAKLGDSARAPVLIATQYGEGYVWIADPVHAEPRPGGSSSSVPSRASRGWPHRGLRGGS